jgi:small-conductance mechanosensitive channel
MPVRLRFGITLVNFELTIRNYVERKDYFQEYKFGIDTGCDVIQVCRRRKKRKEEEKEDKERRRRKNFSLYR